MSEQQKQGTPPFWFVSLYRSPQERLPVSKVQAKKMFRKVHQPRAEAARRQCTSLPALSREELDAILDLGVNGIWSGYHWSLPQDQVTELLDNGYCVVSNVADNRPLSPSGDPDDFDGILDNMRARFMGREGEYILAAAWEFVFPFVGKGSPKKVRSRKDAFKLYQAYRQSRDRVFGHYRNYCRERGIEKRNLPVILGSHEQWHHYSAEWGATVLFSEGGCNLPNSQVRIAAVRGAARQYRVRWFSFWSASGPINRSWVVYNSQGRQISGSSAGLYLRRWLMSFYAGSDFCLCAECVGNQGFYTDTNGRRRVSDFGRKAKAFSDFVFNRHPDRGKPFVPVALMLDYYHGWEPRSHRVWAGALPYTQDEEMIDNFFNVAFPDQEKAAFITLHQPWQYKRYPWSSQKECFSLWREGKIDHRRYEKGELVDSTWGDSFDIVLDNCPLSKLKAYRAVFLLGSVKLEDKLKARLTEYVNSGGVLLANITQVRRQDGELFGVDFTGKHAMLWEVGCTTCGRVFRDRRAEIELVSPVTASTLLKATTDEVHDSLDVKRVPGYDQADPVAVSNKIGEGRVILTTLPYMQSSACHSMHPAFCDLIDHIMADVSPVEVQGPPIEYLVNETGRGFIVSLLHNGPDFWNGDDPETWQGCIRLKDAAGLGDNVTVRELWSDTDISFQKQDGVLNIAVDVEPYRFKIIGIETA